MKTKVKLTNSVHQEFGTKKGDTGYVDGYVAIGEYNIPHAMVVMDVSKKVIAVPTYQIKVISKGAK